MGRAINFAYALDFTPGRGQLRGLHGQYPRVGGAPLGMELLHLVQDRERGRIREGEILEQVVVRLGLQGLERQLPQGLVGREHERGLAAQLSGGGREQVPVERERQLAVAQVALCHLAAETSGVAEQRGQWSGQMIDAQIGRRTRSAGQHEEVDLSLGDHVFQQGGLPVGQGGDQVRRAHGFEGHALYLELRVRGIELAFKGSIFGARLLQQRGQVCDALAVRRGAVGFAEDLVVEAGQHLLERRFAVLILRVHRLGDAAAAIGQHVEQGTGLVAFGVGERGFGVLQIQLQQDHVMEDAGLRVHEMHGAHTVAGKLLAELFRQLNAFEEGFLGLRVFFLAVQGHAAEVQRGHQHGGIAGLARELDGHARVLHGGIVVAGLFGDFAQHEARGVGIGIVADALGQLDRFLQVVRGRVQLVVVILHVAVVVGDANARVHLFGTGAELEGAIVGEARFDGVSHGFVDHAEVHHRSGELRIVALLFDGEALFHVTERHGVIVRFEVSGAEIVEHQPLFPLQAQFAGDFEGDAKGLGGGTEVA